MGFAAGLGEGFSNSFNQGMQNNAQHKADVFRMAYDNYTNNKRQYDADKKSDEKIQSDAKGLVSALPGVPAAAWTHAYHLLKAGMSPDQVVTKLSTAKFSDITNDTPPADTPASPTDNTDATSKDNAGPLDLNAQMKDSGLGASPTDTQANAQPTPPAAAPAPEANPNPVIAPQVASAVPPAGTDATQPTVPAPVAPQPMPASARPAGPMDAPQAAAAPVAPQAPTPPTAQNPLDKIGAGLQSFGDQVGKNMSDLFDPKARQARQMQQGDNAVMQATGISPDQLKQVQAGYTPPDIQNTVAIDTLGAKTSTSQHAYPGALNEFADYGIDTQSGLTKSTVSGVDVTMKQYEKGTPDQQAMAARWNTLRPGIQADLDKNDPNIPIKVQNMLANIKDPLQKLTAAKTDTVNLLQLGKSLDDTVQKNNAVLTVAGQGVAWTDQARIELSQSFKLAQGVIQGLTQQNNGEMPDAASAAAAADAAVNDYVNKSLGGNAQLGNAYREYVAKSIRFAYAAGGALGQSGAKMSDKDFEKMMQAFETANSPQAFSDNLRNFANERVLAVNNQIQGVRSLPEALMALDDKDAKKYMEPSLSPVEANLDADTKAWMSSSYASDKKAGLISDTGATANNPNAKAAPQSVLTVDDKMIAKAPSLKAFLGKKVTIDLSNGKITEVP